MGRIMDFLQIIGLIAALAAVVAIMKPWELL
jgi:hypothetical protein